MQQIPLGFVYYRKAQVLWQELACFSHLTIEVETTKTVMPMHKNTKKVSLVRALPWASYGQKCLKVERIITKIA